MSRTKAAASAAAYALSVLLRNPCQFLSNAPTGFEFCRIRNCLSQMYQKDITADEKKELDEALQREVRCSKPEWIGFALLVCELKR